MGRITVSGYGEIEVRPDSTAISISFSGLEPTFGEAVYVSTEKIHRLKESLRKDGIGDPMIEDRRNSIRKSEHSVRGKKTEEYRYVFDGYRYEYALTARFPIDLNRLGSILMHISGMDVGFELDYWYESSDIEGEKLKALEMAVKDAKQKAEIIAKASGRELMAPVDISDGSFRIDYDECYDGRRMNCCESDMGAPPVMDINPRDTTVSARVETVWESS